VALSCGWGTGRPPAAAALGVVALAVAIGTFFVGGIGRVAEGAVALAYDAPAVPVVEHEDGEVGERLAGTADLGLLERQWRVGGARGQQKQW